MMIYLFLPFLLLWGCVPIPKEEAACTLLNSPSLDQTINAGLAQDLIVEDQIPFNWWVIFEDPVLSDMIHWALSKNPTLQEAIAKIDQASNEARIRKSFLFPTIDLSATVLDRHLAKYGFFRAFAPSIPAHVTETIIGLDFAYEFDFWGKRENLYRAALGEMKAKEAEKAQANLLISTALAVVYYRLQSHIAKFDILLKQQKILVKLVELRKRRQAEAIDSLSQVLSAEYSLDLVNQQIVINKENQELDQHLLLNLLGGGPDEELLISQIILAKKVKIPIPESIKIDLLAHRPDLMAQIWRVEAAAYEVGAAIADFFPNITLNASGGVDSVFFDKLFTQGSLFSTITPALHLPIFNAGRIQANLGKKRAIFMEEIMVYNRLLLNAAKEVADNISFLRSADLNLSLQLAKVANRQKFQKIAQQRFLHALNNKLETLDADLELLQQLWNEADSEYQYTLSAIQLIKAIGGGYQSECIP